MKITKKCLLVKDGVEEKLLIVLNSTTNTLLQQQSSLLGGGHLQPAVVLLRMTFVLREPDFDPSIRSNICTIPLLQID